MLQYRKVPELEHLSNKPGGLRVVYLPADFAYVRSGVAQPCSGGYDPLRIMRITDQLYAQTASLFGLLLVRPELLVLLLELLDATSGIHELLPAREERMTCRTDVQPDLSQG